jgi:phage repressor protein C with HTH and peptisase S24 domain
MKGCYVYFMDKETERFVRSRTEHMPAQKLIPYENALPLLDLRAVADAGYDSAVGLFADEESFEYVAVEGGPFPRDRFLVRAEGDSMEPKIPDGSLCLFRKDPGGSRNGKIVLCVVEGFAGSASLAVIKKYESTRTPSEADTIGEAQSILLTSLNPAHEPIELTEGQEFSILGVFERVI